MASTITVTSEQFSDGGDLPIQAAHPFGGGANLSPQLSWSGAPDGTRSFAVTCWDPDAPTTVGFTHWVRIDMPADITSIAAGAGTVAGPWVDGLSDWGDHGWGGMAPPPGDAHRYVFTVWALDVASLGLDDQTTYAKFRFMVRDHVLATGEISGTFASAG